MFSGKGSGWNFQRWPVDWAVEGDQVLLGTPKIYPSPKAYNIQWHRPLPKKATMFPFSTVCFKKATKDRKTKRLWFCNFRSTVPFHTMHDILCQHFPFPVFRSFHIPSHISRLPEMNTIWSRTSRLLTPLGALPTSPPGAAAPGAPHGPWGAPGGDGRAGAGRLRPSHLRRAGPSRAQPGRAEQGRAEPSRAGPGRAERGIMLGMVKNSLLSTVEAWPYRLLSKGEKVCAGAGGAGAAGSAGIAPGLPAPPGSASIPISLPRISSATRRGRARAAGSRRWSWWGSRLTKPRRKGQWSSSSTSEEATTRVRDAARPAGLGGCLWLRLGESRMDEGNGTAGQPGLWLPALGVSDGDGPSLGKVNSQQVKSCPANSCYESAYNSSLWQGDISKIILLSRNELPCSWDNMRTGRHVSITAPWVSSTWWNPGYLGHFSSMMCPCGQWNNSYDLDILSGYFYSWKGNEQWASFLMVYRNVLWQCFQVIAPNSRFTEVCAF